MGLDWAGPSLLLLWVCPFAPRLRLSMPTGLPVFLARRRDALTAAPPRCPPIVSHWPTDTCHSPRTDLLHLHQPAIGLQQPPAHRCDEPITLDQLRNSLYNISADSDRSDTLRLSDFLRLCIAPQERMADHLQALARADSNAPNSSSCATQARAEQLHRLSAHEAACDEPARLVTA